MSNQISSKSNLRAVLAILFLMAGIGSSTRAADASLSQTPQQQMPGLTAKAGTAANIFNVMGASDTTYTVPQTGNYTITVRGADGGNASFDGNIGGSGATVAATFALQAGDMLTQVTGIAGASGANAGGGGGGSAVILDRGGVRSLLLVAAGGGGGGFSAGGSGGDGSQFAPSGGAGGIAGGGGGFGINAAGGNGTSGATGGGAGTLAGGGASGGVGVGGIGGGGGGYGFGGGGGGSGGDSAGGGGGGYGGGIGGVFNGGGGGGSSFVDSSATNITRTNGVNGGGTSRNGAVSVPLAPTAATVSISGRVLTMRGRGIMNVRLSLTDSSGQTRTATTISFGYYHFDAVQVGETYILSAVGKHYTFSRPLQFLNVNEETNEVNFIANSEKRLRVF